MLVEQLNDLADQIQRGEPIAPTELHEQTLRLLTGVVVLLRRHEVNKRGRCRVCGRSKIWVFWFRRPPCTVYQSIDFVMRQPLNMVRSQLRDRTIR